MRTEAKTTVKDTTDFVAVNKKIMEIFEEYLNKHGKQKVHNEIEKMAEDIKKSRGVKKAAK